MAGLITFESSNKGLKSSQYYVGQASRNRHFLIQVRRYYCLVMLLAIAASKTEVYQCDPLQGVYVAISRHSNGSGYQDQLTAFSPISER